MRNFDRNLQIITIILTVINLLFSASIEVKSEIFTIASFNSFDLNFATRVIILITLELILASTFGLGFSFFSKRYFEKEEFFPWYIIGIAVIALISAWVSVFNIRFFVFTKNLDGALDYLVFFSIILIAFFFSMMFITWHIGSLVKEKHEELKKEHKEILPIVFQAFGFVIIFICVLIEKIDYFK